MARVCEILVVEDDTSIGELVREILDDEGYRVTVARDYRAATAALARATFDFVLLDSPGTVLTDDQWGAMVRLRERAGATPVVLFTAHHHAQIADHTGHGFHAVLHKPFTLDDLLAVVHRTLPDECAPVSDAA